MLTVCRYFSDASAWHCEYTVLFLNKLQSNCSRGRSVPSTSLSSTVAQKLSSHGMGVRLREKVHCRPHHHQPLPGPGSQQEVLVPIRQPQHPLVADTGRDVNWHRIQSELLCLQKFQFSAAGFRAKLCFQHLSTLLRSWMDKWTMARTCTKNKTLAQSL